MSAEDPEARPEGKGWDTPPAGKWLETDVIGEPLDDEQVRELGYQPVRSWSWSTDGEQTDGERDSSGWVPLVRGPRDEQAEQLATAVAEILREEWEPSLPMPVREIAAARSAAHRILEEGEFAEPERSGAIRRLLDVSDRAEHPELVRHGVLAEVDWHADVVPPPGGRFPFEIAAERLRRAGYGACPTCHREVLGQEDLDLLQRQRREWLARERLHLESVEEGVGE